MKTPPLIRLLLRLHAGYFVKVMYLALLERDADDQGLAVYRAQLSRTSDLTDVARSIARSEEAWNKTIRARPEHSVTAAFRGLLGRDPETDALESYCADLATNKDLAALLGDIGQSEEHWQRLLGVHAETVVQATFRALLKREPDGEALAAYTQELQRTSDLSAFISDISESAEHWELLLHPKRLTSDLLLTDDLGTLLAEVVKSPKVWNELAALRFPHAGAASDSYEQEAWVFIHAQKTGGTSLQNMLVDTFGDRQVYREHTDTLYMRSPAELAQYTIFAGHFDYTSASYIPRRTRRLFTFLREPRQRLLSHYRFLRAHEPTSPFFKGSVKIANQLDAVDFFRAVNVLMPSGFWNHLTWCVMGQRRWKEYRQQLFGLDEPSLAVRLEDIRAEIKQRLNEFSFIGLQEDYPHSCERLFEHIGANVPHLRHDHSVELLSANLASFKFVARRELTPQLEDALAALVQLDDIIYQEGRELYARRWGRIPEGDGYRPL